VKDIRRPGDRVTASERSISQRSCRLAAEVQFHPMALRRQTMIQTLLAINGQDCMIGDGNTAEELEAIAVTLLRTAEATCFWAPQGHGGG
jgi:hypothetical protein